jgi:hypothetical protein
MGEGNGIEYEDVYRETDSFFKKMVYMGMFLDAVLSLESYSILTNSSPKDDYLGFIGIAVAGITMTAMMRIASNPRIDVGRQYNTARTSSYEGMKGISETKSPVAGVTREKNAGKEKVVITRNSRRRD